MKVKELKPGQVFKYAGYDWIKLEQEGLALTKDILEKRIFDEECNNWGKSEIRKYLNNDFYETLIENGADEEDFLSVKTDLIADDGTNKYAACYDNVSLMTADLYRSNRRLLKPLESWWWLATPHSRPASDSYYVWCVYSSDALNYYYAYDGNYGVRPLIKLHNNAEVSFDGESCSQELEENAVYTIADEGGKGMKVKELKPGQVFKYAGYEWIKLEQEGLALMKDILEERAFDKESNDWRKSELGEYLNDDFYERLKKRGADEKDFLMIETNLTADDGMKDYETIEDFVSLMTADLYRSNRRLLKPLESWWWLVTPHSCLASHSYTVCYVNSSGVLGSNYADIGSFGVRPLIKLCNNTKVSVDEENVTETNTDITEKIKQWATERGIDKAEPEKQFLKVIEEVGELAEGMAKGRAEQVKDSIGDVYVTLVILSMQLGYDIEDCIKIAYDEIKGRKGKIMNGVFVKDDDL